MVTLSEHQGRRHGAKCHRYCTAEFEARDILRKQGFPVVVRSTDPSFPVSLIAWSKTGGVHIFRVVSTRHEIANVSDVVALFHEEIEQLREVPRTVADSVNLWVRTGRETWRIYRIFPGGIAEAGGPDVARE